MRFILFPFLLHYSHEQEPKIIRCIGITDTKIRHDHAACRDKHNGFGPFCWKRGSLSQIRGAA